MNTEALSPDAPVVSTQDAPGPIATRSIREVLARWQDVPEKDTAQVIAEILWHFAWQSTPLSNFAAPVLLDAPPVVAALQTTWPNRWSLLTTGQVSPTIEQLYETSRQIQYELWQIMLRAIVAGAAPAGEAPAVRAAAQGWAPFAKEAARFHATPWVLFHPSVFEDLLRDPGVSPLRVPSGPNTRPHLGSDLRPCGAWNLPGFREAPQLYTASLLPPDRLFVGWKSAYSAHRLPGGSLGMFSGFGLRPRRTKVQEIAFDTDFTAVAFPESLSVVELKNA